MSKSVQKRPWLRSFLALVSVAALLVPACSPGHERDRGGRLAIRVWAHAGQEAERRVLEDQARRFNADQDSLHVELSFLPEGGYSAQVQASALAGDLPDLLELDGPFVASYAWQGRLRPLGDLLADSLLAGLLPSLLAQGRYRGELYALGCFDSGLGLYGRRSLLRTAVAEAGGSSGTDGEGTALPTSPEEAWSVDRFEAILRALARQDPDGQVLDLKLNYAGEWYTYAFSPLIQSAGGDLVARETDASTAPPSQASASLAPLQAEGVLDGAASQAAMRRVQGWIEDGLVDPNVDDAAFVSGRVTLALGGHWNYDAYAKAWGEDLVLLPLPDFGRGTRTGMGSWCWSLPDPRARGEEGRSGVARTQGSEDRLTGDAAEHEPDPHSAAAAAFLRFLLSDDEVLRMADANGAVPGTRGALERSTLYGPAGSLRLFAAQLLGGFAVPRPRTPAYPIITEAFQQAFDSIRAGEDVAASLQKAARVIDREIADNEGYPPVARKR